MAEGEFVVKKILIADDNIEFAMTLHGYLEK